ncbi:MAG: AAA family ATPase [Pseudomonadota bacterium]
MKLRELHLKAFGPFTNRVINFGAATQRLVLVHGPNEAGKSSALRAISDLRFGISQLSKDNFIHAHPDMRIGGVFVDRQGTEYSLMRRKGRTSTLLFADFELDELTSELPVSSQIEALLTCNLTKDEYDSMFGLDHHRLREGGEALLQGKGEVGAALFEASAGVRSIPQILERLDASARKFFMPGTRGKNANINEALKAYEDRHSEFKQAQVRPAHWADLFRKHQAIVGEVTGLEGRRDELNSKLLLVKELRAVAPLLRTLDHASKIVEDLQSVTLLSLTAATERAAAESGFADAHHNASITVAEVSRQQQRLAKLSLDTPILDVAQAVKRLAASAETIDRHRVDLAEVLADITSETGQVVELAARIDLSKTSEEILARAPAKAARVAIEQRLRDIELATQALDHHLETGRQHSETEELDNATLPAPAFRTTLRIAQGEITRSDATLKRLAALPAEIKAARRTVATALDTMDLVDESMLRRMRPLLDAQIDVAMKLENDYETRCAGLKARIGDITNALHEKIKQRDQCLEQGAVPTRDDVQRVRLHRDAGWAMVRGTYIDGTRPSIEAFTGSKPLAVAYEEAVIEADRRVDELANDTERAAQLQSIKRTIEGLEGDREELKLQLEELDQNEGVRQAAWSQTLITAHLPVLSPVALRDWQALLQIARADLESLQLKVDEFEQAQATAQELATRLRDAIIGTGLAIPVADASLITLSATAVEIDEAIKQREMVINTAAGKKLERERQHQQRVVRELELTTALKNAEDGMRQVLADLLLPQHASVAVTRARIGEFDDLVSAKDRATTSLVKERRLKQALSVMEDSAKAIWETLGDPKPVDLRLYVEHVSVRLATAEEVQTARQIAQQALDTALIRQREHEETATRHQRIIEKLCLAAGVVSPNLLPEAEEQSRRKRDAQNEADRSKIQLAQASRRSIDELRTLLADHDAARMDAEELAWTQEQSQVDEMLRDARKREEDARRILEAIDGSDVAAAARDAMERAAASVRNSMSPWIRSKLAHGLLTEALKRFRDRAQGPMLTAASGYFERMTLGEFVRLISDDTGPNPVLIAERGNGSRIRVEAMSEGTRDQLYLALRLAALDIRRVAGVDLPVILDDVLITSDDDRSGAMLDALAEFARENQVIVFTHHRHIVDVATKCVSTETLAVVPL